MIVAERQKPNVAPGLAVDCENDISRLDAGPSARRPVERGVNQLAIFKAINRGRRLKLASHAVTKHPGEIRCWREHKPQPGAHLEATANGLHNQPHGAGSHEMRRSWVGP